MGFFESAKMFANQAVDSTRYAAQKTKLKSNIKSEENNIERQYTEIGRYYFNKYVNNPDPEVVQFYDNAKRSMDAIYRHNQEIARIESMEAAMNQGGNHQYGQPNPQGFNQNIQGGVTPAEPQNIAPAASQADNNSEQ